MSTAATKGLIFDIQGHSIHDGPGTRTLVFFSGCPLRCTWCSNPEGLLPRQRLMYKAQLCKQCPDRCVSACPNGGVHRSIDGDSHVNFDRAQCSVCDTLECVKVCYRQALQISGRWYSEDELMRVFHRDRTYWGAEGGVTLTGGEPLLQHEFVLPLLERCRDVGISVCVETSGYVERHILEAALPSIQWLFVDLKHLEENAHVEQTGVSNQLILDNIRFVQSADWSGRLVVRMPVIPGFNDNQANAKITADFLRDVGLDEINLLPFHRLGASKYEQLGMHYAYADQPALTLENLLPLASVFRDRGIRCYLGANTPF
jgi:glycyl-radical enzyme activating protein